MSQLSIQQRKLVYVVAILILLGPIGFFGLPSGAEGGNEGHLAHLRDKYELGQTSLGNVDPASATMNLVLLGMRGVASNVLWQQAIDQKEKKQWGELRATVDSIVLLQPNFQEVWEFQGWNLAYNVSAEWDGVADRYHWVKAGAKFIAEGSNRNQKYPNLYHEVGRILGQKVGRADEWRIFRKYFLHDPDDPKFDHSIPPDQGDNLKILPDQELNADGKDNYLVAKKWYFDANEVEAQPNTSRLKADKILFRSNPVRAQIGYADALQREGSFGEKSRNAWEVADEELRTTWGKERFMSPGGIIILESDDETIAALCAEDGQDPEIRKEWTSRYQNKTNYRYWRLRCQAEKEKLMAEAHRELFDGKEAYLKQGDIEKGHELLESGIRKLDTILAREEFADLKNEDNLIEEGLKALVMWRSILQLKGLPLPDDYPLKSLYLQHPDRYTEYDERFRSQYGAS